MPEQTTPSKGISRRDVIKRGALVGGAVIWAPPVIESFTSRAFAASGAGFPCSYATIIFTLAGSTTLQAVKLNDPSPGCNLTNTDGMYAGQPLGAPCNGVQYAVGGPGASNNQLTANTVVIPPAGSCPFTINGCTVTATGGATIRFVLIHDGSFGPPGGPSGNTLNNGTTICGAATSFTVHGGCGCA